jgi:hypothetical protein
VLRGAQLLFICANSAHDLGVATHLSVKLPSCLLSPHCAACDKLVLTPSVPLTLLTCIVTECWVRLVTTTWYPAALRPVKHWVVSSHSRMSSHLSAPAAVRCDRLYLSDALMMQCTAPKPKAAHGHTAAAEGQVSA